MDNLDNTNAPVEITLKLIDQNADSFYMDLNNDTDFLIIQTNDYIIETSNKK